MNADAVLIPANDRSHWANASLSQRLEKFQGIFVKHKAIKKVADFVEAELVLRKVEMKANGVLVIAGSGSGKTSFVNFLKRQYPDVDTPTMSTRPVVCFKVPAVPSPSSMGSALLRALGDPLYDRGSWEDKKDRAENLLLKAGTIIIAIDDFQDVPSRRKARGVEHIANWIRDLCDFKFPGLVFALGTEQAAVVRDAHDQLRRRMQARFELPVFSMVSETDIKNYLSLLELVDRGLPLAEHSELKSMKLARPLLAATNGILDYLMKLMARALVRAVQRGSERIEKVDLELGFEDLHQVAAVAGNPFAADWNGEALTGPGQIFELRQDGPDDAGVKKTSRRGQRATKAG
jgi:Bacterial TniB protein